MNPIVRAIDVGFGWTKFVTDDSGDRIRCDQFASVALPSLIDPSKRNLLGGHRQTTHTFVGGMFYEVGHEIDLAGVGLRADLPIEGYVESPEYLALLRGAMYCMPGISRIDLLVVGLPVSVLLRHKAQLERLVVGEHEVGGRKISVAKALAVAQPQGALVSFAAQHNLLKEIKKQETLIIDCGSRTFDWLTARGLRLVCGRSDSVPIGTHNVLESICRVISHAVNEPYDNREAVDLALRRIKPLTVYGKAMPIEQFRPMIEAHATEAARAMLHSLGPTSDIEHVVLVGGGAFLFKRAVKKALHQHRVHELDEPQFVNVRGFQRAGMDRMAMRAGRSLPATLVNAEGGHEQTA